MTTEAKVVPLDRNSPEAKALSWREQALRVSLAAKERGYTNSSISVAMAETFVGVGWVPIPLEGKKPIPRGWESFTKEQGLQSVKDKGASAGVFHLGPSGDIYDAPFFNVGIVTGAPSGHVAVDLDVPDEKHPESNGLINWQKIAGKYPEAFQTYTVKTGSGGKHLYYKYVPPSTDPLLKTTGDLRSAPLSKGKVKLGIDIKTTGGQIVGPNSIHPATLQPYEVESNLPIREMPQGLLNDLLALQGKTTSGGKSKKTLSTEGTVRVLQQEGLLDDRGKPTIQPRYKPLPFEATCELIRALKLSRSDDREIWLKVIWALRDACDKQDPSQAVTEPQKYMDLAIEFSRKSPKFKDTDEVSQIFFNADLQREDHANTGTLFNFLKEDIPLEDYKAFRLRHRLDNVHTFTKKFQDTEITPVALEYCDGHLNDAKLARLFAHYYKPFIKMTADNNWYSWNPHTLLWRAFDHNQLGGIVTDRLPLLLQTISKYYQEQAALVPSPPEDGTEEAFSKAKAAEEAKQTLIEKSEDCLKHANKLGDTPSIKRVIFLFPEYLVDTDFYPKLDDIDDLLPIEEGYIVDLTKGLKGVRLRTSTDYFTKIAPVTFDPKARSPEFEKFLLMITLGDPDVIEHLQLWLGYNLTGALFARLFVMWQGENNNAKTSFKTIMEYILGPFWGKIAKGVMIDSGVKTAANAHNTQDSTLEGVRSGWCDEVLPGDKINLKTVKEVTGSMTGSKYQVRDPHGKYRLIRLMAKLTLLMNHPVVIESPDDPAIWARLLFVLWKAKFVDKPNPKSRASVKGRLVPNEFKGIGDFVKTKFNNKKEKSAIFNWLLIGAQKAYEYSESRVGFPIPESLKISCEAYRTTQDFYEMFISDELVRDPQISASSSIASNQCWTLFDAWAKTHLPPEQKVTQQTFAAAMEKKFSKVKASSYRYKGLRPRTKEEKDALAAVAAEEERLAQQPTTEGPTNLGIADLVRGTTPEPPPEFIVKPLRCPCPHTTRSLVSVAGHMWCLDCFNSKTETELLEEDERRVKRALIYAEV